MGETFGVRQLYSGRFGFTPEPCGRVGAMHKASRLVLMVGGALWFGGCSMSLPSLWERTQTAPPAAATAAATPAADPMTTGSVRRPADTPGTQPTAAPGALPIPQADWDAAKAVLMAALADSADTPSLPWENPASGMSGTITALQRANGTSGQVCRDFLGSGIKDGKEAWFDGRACRTSGAWAVTELRPWRRT